MIDLSPYPLTIGTTSGEPWMQPVLDRGRGAAFVDTGFIRALMDGNDRYHARAESHFKRATVNCYTTSLVLAEAIRQVAKSDGLNYRMRTQWFDFCKSALIDTERIYVCVPPRIVLMEAFRELESMRPSLPDLDLCDTLSIAVLNHASHKRVFGFDSHFTTFGAQLEP
jgi:predicted nucleic acid-binding protein